MDGTLSSDTENPAGGSVPTDGEAPAVGGAYRVLARKYRPSNFDDLIGQEPMVRTLSNAFDTGRIAQGWILTGVRGVGKTTTARILARALNFEIPGEIDKPTIHLDRLGTHCQAIMEGRHVDVIEMDAASHTGIADIREITDAARYRPVSARYKVYIIDEVHMLSNAAFNGLLKTLEEPPEHVKFIFATTEIRKVPVTVLSRCQRFDLRRIEAGTLVAHLRRISDAEKVEIEDEALALIARAAEGSVRDALSLLDQAMAHGDGKITAEDLRSMLGLADRARVIDLFERAMKGDAAGALSELRAQYDIGADPGVVLTDLADFVHLVTRLKIVPDAGDDASVTEMERQRGQGFARDLSMRVLNRAWQMLLKAIPEVQNAPKPLAAADMALVRLCYAADLPTPDEALRRLTEDGGQGGAIPGGNGPAGGTQGGPIAQGGGSVSAQGSQSMPASGPTSGPRLHAVAGGRSAVKAEPEAYGHSEIAPRPDPAPPPPAEKPAHAGERLTSLEDVAALCARNRELTLKFAVERQMRLVKFEQGRIEVVIDEGAQADAAGRLGHRLGEWTGDRWMVVVVRGEAGPTIYEERQAEQAKIVSDAMADPAVNAVLEAFPGAKVVDVRVLESEEPAEEAVPLPDEELGDDGDGETDAGTGPATDG
ncbi:DNA polymerase-3 subunit gamma/tau [Breoghania corrubedonensis]|uniref:DNA polymerase III subunit gamma/tau n=1 Tax=Breoghania corrubedonensis TaxID=665038 RepID=A0A2T5VH31_9HYPH|nr:DNA polymerase III subunit gamma/tau [Breoghania corrubedonensis]PTW63061.1 DNA polymerase-3 subunit gamma/tau [Breoghania corrubedonensis]